MNRLFRTVCATLCLISATIAAPVAHAAPAHKAAATSHVAAPTSGASEYATATDQNNATVITTRLVASHREIAAGQPIQIAWEFKLAPHWHIYWQNAGDSGLPPELKPTTGNPQALQFTWPTPMLISVPPITNYGYEGNITLTTTYIVPEGLAHGLNVLPFKATFLYCNDVCMPGRAELKLPIIIGTKPVRNKEFKTATNLPMAMPATNSLVAETTGQTLQLNLPLNLANPGIHFIPAQDGVIDDSAPQSLTGNILSIPLDTQAEKIPDTISGLLLYNGQGYQFSVPLHNSPQHGNAEAAPTPPAAAQPDASPAQASLFGAVFFAFLAGIILNLMPCVLPVLSLKLLSLVRHHHGPTRIHHTVAYTLGVLASFWAFAIVIAFLKHSGAELGWGFHLQNPMFVATLILILLAVALNFFDIFELGGSLTRLGGKPGNHPSLAASFATGVLAVVVATPCTVPFMGGAMAYALTQPFIGSFLVFTSLGLGLALPFLIAIPFPSVFRWLPKPGKWMSTFRHLLGWPMLATALWLLYVFASQTGQSTTFLLLAVSLLLALLLWIYGAKPSLFTALLCLIVAAGGLYLVNGFSLRPQVLVWKTWSVAGVEEARKTGNPVFVDFTADWCLTCKVTEATVLNTKTVQTLFADTKTTLFQGDWTNQNPEITEELAKHNRRGVPLYLLYLPGKDAEILPQLITPSLLKSKLKPNAA